MYYLIVEITGEDVLDGISWTSTLDVPFKMNFEENPTLLWQYFASSQGFMRQYPGKSKSHKEKAIILYVCLLNGKKNMYTRVDVDMYLQQE